MTEVMSLLLDNVIELLTHFLSLSPLSFRPLDTQGGLGSFASKHGFDC